MSWTDQINALNQNINDVIGLNNQRTVQGLQQRGQTLDNMTNNIFTSIGMVADALKNKRARTAAEKAQQDQFAQRTAEINANYQHDLSLAANAQEAQVARDRANAELQKELEAMRQKGESSRLYLSMGGSGGTKNASDLQSYYNNVLGNIATRHPQMYVYDQTGNIIGIDTSKLDSNTLRSIFEASISDKPQWRDQLMTLLNNELMGGQQGALRTQANTWAARSASARAAQAGPQPSIEQAGLGGGGGVIPATRAPAQNSPQVPVSIAIDKINSLLTQIKSSRPSVSAGSGYVPNPDISTLQNMESELQGGNVDVMRYQQIMAAIQKLQSQY